MKTKRAELETVVGIGDATRLRLARKVREMLDALESLPRPGAAASGPAAIAQHLAAQSDLLAKVVATAEKLHGWGVSQGVVVNNVISVVQAEEMRAIALRKFTRPKLVAPERATPLLEGGGVRG